MKNYHKNPRQIKDKQFANLRAWLAELEWVQSFGDVAPVFVVNSVDDALKAIEAI